MVSRLFVASSAHVKSTARVRHSRDQNLKAKTQSDPCNTRHGSRFVTQLKGGNAQRLHSSRCFAQSSMFCPLGKILSQTEKRLLSNFFVYIKCSCDM